MVRPNASIVRGARRVDGGLLGLVGSIAKRCDHKPTRNDQEPDLRREPSDGGRAQRPASQAHRPSDDDSVCDAVPAAGDPRLLSGLPPRRGPICPDPDRWHLSRGLHTAAPRRLSALAPVQRRRHAPGAGDRLPSSPVDHGVAFRLFYDSPTPVALSSVALPAIRDARPAFRPSDSETLNR